MTEREKVENCYHRMYDGMVKKDAGLLSEVLDDSFILLHMTGMKQSKEAFIQAVENGTLNYYSASHQQIKTDIQKETAELTGRSIVSAAMFGGGRHTWRLQLHIRLVKKEQYWVILKAKASAY